jgi:hypothetical protein
MVIISDFPHHKIDLTMTKDGYVQFTVFHRKGDEWTVKVVGISPEAFDKTVEIVNQFRVEQQILNPKEP